jgi:hypothetical protein
MPGSSPYALHPRSVHVLNSKPEMQTPAGSVGAFMVSRSGL